MNLNKKYDIIYADPPWRYESQRCIDVKSALNEKENFHYPTMSFDEIYNLPIKEITNKNCLLFLWVVSPKIPECLVTGVKWGFKYITIGFVWEKILTNPGNYTLSSIEMCAIFKKGKIPIPRGSRTEKQFLYRKKQKHSQKPDEIRKRIENMFPTQSKIELFARNQYPGWDVWGNDSNYIISKKRREKQFKQKYIDFEVKNDI